MARAPRGGRSGAEPLASARAARGNHLAAAFGRHPGAEAVAALAHQIARLKGPLHGSFSAGIAPPRGVGPGPRIHPGFGGFAECSNSRAYTAGRRYSALRRPPRRHKRVSTPHKAVKAPFRRSRSAKIVPTCAGACRRRMSPWPDYALEPTMSDDKHPSSAAASAGHSKFPLRRLVPLIIVVAASAVVFAMGWQRQLSFESLVRHHEALRAFITAHEVSALVAYVALYIAAVALSIPVGVFLTMTAGIFFGAVLGGAASVVGATIGAICIFLIAKSAVGDYLVRRAGPLAQKLARGFRADAFSYLL